MARIPMTFRFTSEEYNALRRAAELTEKTMTFLVRERLRPALGLTPIDKEEEDDKDDEFTTPAT